MVTAYARRSFNGGAIATTIPNGMLATDTSFTLALATNWAFANNFYVDVDRGLPTEEKILCSGISGLVVTVASGGRGADGSTAVQHQGGCTVQVVHVAQDDDEANQVVSAVLGQAGAAKGDMLAMLSASGPNTLTRIPIGTTGQFLSATTGGLPSWASITAGNVGSLPSTLIKSSSTLGSGTTSGTGFTGLSTTASATVTTGTKAIVMISGALSSSSAGFGAAIGVAVSGSSTIAASSAFSAQVQGTTALPISLVIPFTGDGGDQGILTAGANVFTVQLKAVTGGTATASNFSITVIPQN